MTEARLAAFRGAGVNRLSFGVQSFRDDELRRLSRLHSADRARAAFGEARAAGFDNVSLDLMMWLPGQRVSEWLESIDEAIALAPEHLSLYMLEVYPNAPLEGRHGARALVAGAGRRRGGDVHWTAMERLDAAGYRAVRNLERRATGPALAAQPEILDRRGMARFRLRRALDAGGVRWKNVSSTDGLHRPDRRRRVAWRSTSRRLTADERLGDALFTGLAWLTESTEMLHTISATGSTSGRGLAPTSSRFSRPGCLGVTESTWQPDPPGNAPCSRSNGGFRLAVSTLK